MAQQLFVENSIDIDAPAMKVWRVFTDPAFSGQMGGEYVTDWKVGSPIGWKALDGMMLTHGTILQVQPGRLLQHELFDTTGSVNSVISYEFHEQESHTILLAREDFKNPLSDLEYLDVQEGWQAALAQVKKVAEKTK